MEITIFTQVKLIAASCSDNARIGRNELARRLEDAGIIADLGSRHPQDALKVALKKLLSSVGKVAYKEGETTQTGRLVSVSTPSKTGVRIDVHLKKADEEGKNFLLIGTILWEQGGDPFWFAASEQTRNLLPGQVLEVLQDMPALVAYGQATCFDTDLRSLVGQVMTENRRFWAGTFLVVGKEEIKQTKALHNVLQDLEGGKVRLAGMTITPDEESLETVRIDMGLALIERLGKVLEELEKMPKGKVLRRNQDAFEQIEREVRRLEGQLGMAFGEEMENALDEVRLGLMSLSFA